MEAGMIDIVVEVGRQADVERCDTECERWL